MRHNSVRNVDSEVVGRIACASLRHEDEVPRTIVGRSCVCVDASATKQLVAVAQSESFFIIIPPKHCQSSPLLDGKFRAKCLSKFALIVQAGLLAASSQRQSEGRSERATRYSCPRGAITALTRPVRPIASAFLVDFAGSGFVSVATALLTKPSCTGLGVGSTTAALGLPG